ncbi:MAG: hypothetical protein Pg6C_15510 [Treponemataceae bacterium]|nr:MAG: hypothetical protein Pg6C_15510 [Treponemataceae bacterium]
MTEGGASSNGRIKATSFLPGKLDKHYDDHAADFDEHLTPKQYEERARKFFDKPVTKDILWFEDVDGVLYKYDKVKKEFGMCTPQGAIITYFIPDDGLKYWQKQVEKYAI